MSNDFEIGVKRRFDETFGIERLPMFKDLISSLEADGQYAAAKALKAMIDEVQSSDR